jgi:L-lactate permease
MTPLAADANFSLGAVITAGAGIVILDEAGGVAFGAAGVPVLVRAGPVEPIPGREVLIGIEVIPAVSLNIPDYVERLEPAWFGGNEILLERGYAHDAGDLEGAHLAVSALGLD